jgi:hypothetical protein
MRRRHRVLALGGAVGVLLVALAAPYSYAVLAIVLPVYLAAHCVLWRCDACGEDLGRWQWPEQCRECDTRLREPGDDPRAGWEAIVALLALGVLIWSIGSRL